MTGVMQQAEERERGSAVANEKATAPLRIRGRTFASRLFVGTGKYATYEQMRACLDASGCEVVTVAVRRERLYDRENRSLLDFIDTKRYTILPNTAGCFTAEDAVRVVQRPLIEQVDDGIVEQRHVVTGFASHGGRGLRGSWRHDPTMPHVRPRCKPRGRRNAATCPQGAGRCALR